MKSSALAVRWKWRWRWKVRIGDGVGALLLSDGGHAYESIPQGLKPLPLGAGWRAKPEGLAYLEAFALCANAHISKSRYGAPDFVASTMGHPAERPT